jgi:elongation factor Ts
MEISAKDVKALREATGAGMMDCKKALAEANGDFEKAVDLLRKKGQKVSASRAGRDAKEGAIFILGNSDNSRAYLIELNSETDFVARNGDFQDMGMRFVETAKENDAADLESLLNLKIDGRSINEHLTDAMGRIGEKIDLSKYEHISGDEVVTYLHPGSRIGVAVAFSNTNGMEVESIGKDIAMQIAAMSPLAVDQDEVPAELIEKEKEIGMEQARNEGKPEQILEKIAMGKVSKFLKENTLLNQDFVKDTSKTVGQYLKEYNPNLKIKAFKRLQLGA